MFLKKPFISILLVGSMMAILTAGCGRSGQAAGADMSATATPTTTTQTTGATATNRTTDASSAAATTATLDTVEADEQTVERPTGWSGPPTATTAIRTTTSSFHKIRSTRSLSPSILRSGPRCRQIWWSCLARPALAAGGMGQASPAAAVTVNHLAGGGMRPPEGQPPAEGEASPQGMQPSAGGQRPPSDEMQPPEGGGFPGGGGAPGGMDGNPDMTPVNPTWVEGMITFNGETWTHVGVRYKGNSTLTRAWQSGSAKLPLKLDFDEFEDDIRRSITSGSMDSSSCPWPTTWMTRPICTMLWPTTSWRMPGW